MGKKILLHYASLNSNSLAKTGSSTIQSSYLRYLRLQQIDILSLQETHTITTTIPSIDMYLQASQTFWTPHCGIISFSSDYTLSLIPTDHLYQSDRFILCQAHHHQQQDQPFYILNIYAPASSNTERRQFFEHLTNMLHQLCQTLDLSRMIISGDFNYDYHRDIITNKGLYKTSRRWINYLDDTFYNCLQYNDLDTIPTFQRTLGSMSLIDYIYGGTYFQHTIRDAAIQYLQPQWSDHALLSIQFNMGKSPLGPGLWRGNPQYVNNPVFQDKLAQRINQLLLHSTESSPQQQWEDVKSATQQLIKSFGIQHVSWRRTSLKYLERKRNRLLRSKPPPAILLHLLPNIDSMIHNLQQELVDIAALKSGTTWREKGERSVKYLKLIHQQRTHQQTITTLQSPTTSSQQADIHPEHHTTSNLETMKTYAHSFYQQLYTVDHVCDTKIDDYLSNIQFTKQLSSSDHPILTAPITKTDLIRQASKVSTTSSPGSDGLGYPYLLMLFNLPCLMDLILTVYNDAMEGITPISWQDIRVRLLPKKGDLSSLRNWRPISLINCDAKVFTRIIAKRLGPMMKKVINPYQTGFIPQRFIGDNGLALSMIIEQAQGYHIPGVGLLLDQEKAYDRVHPVYLGKVMAALGFPSTSIKCLTSLFFGNQVTININGYFTKSIHQQRGLRQGDPLSPLLFNIAMEPFLLSILQDVQFQGFLPPSGTTEPSPYCPTPIKCLAYADDVCVLLHSVTDLLRLQHWMNQYAAVSNARFNDTKTEAFFLNGRVDEIWKNQLTEMGVTKMYHQGSSSNLRYLGFYIPFSTSQRHGIEQQLLSTIKTQCHIYSQRQLSILGKVTITNSLILSKLWYCLRLLRPTQAFFSSVRSLIYQFIWKKQCPRLAKDLVFAPWEVGGLKVLDPQIQHKIFQQRWLYYTLTPYHTHLFVYPLILAHLSLMRHSQAFPFLPFYYRPARSGPHISRHMSIWPIIFDTFDIMASTDLLPVCEYLVMKDVPKDTILSLPLHFVLRNQASDHWTYRHPNFTTSFFLIFDPSQNRLRLKVPGEYTRYPRLCRQLFDHILNQRSITLAEYVWPHITDSPSNSIPCWANHPTISQMPLLQHFTSPSHIIRSIISAPVHTALDFPTKLIKIFWRCPMYPQARTIFYRSLTKRIPHNALLHIFGTLSSPRCSICHVYEDDRFHFLVGCPRKWTIWHNSLSLLYPTLEFTPRIVYHTLQDLAVPPTMTNIPRYLSVISTILWQIWNLH